LFDGLSLQPRGRRRAVVVALLEDPFSVYDLYNETLDDGLADLRISPEVLEALDPR